MLTMPSLLESRNSSLHLWTSHERKYIQQTFSSMATGRFLNGELRYQEGATSRCRGVRHGRTEAQKEHFIVQNAGRRCLKKKFEGIHDRFLKDSTYLDSQLKNWLD